MKLLLNTLFLLISLSHLAFGFLGDQLHLPPHDDYQEIETANFIIIYPSIYEREAKDVAQFSEEIHAKLSLFFQYSPKRKTRIIVTDSEDSANGVTTPIGQQGFFIYLSSPEPYYTINEYDHWLKLLVIHEYTHYLTLEQTSGFFWVARLLAGNLIFPNLGWPRWLSEGLSVFTESYFTAQGRGYGTFYRTLTRDAVYKKTLGTNDFVHFDRMNGVFPDFPFGEVDYYFGFAIVDEMARTLGKVSLAEIAKEGSFRVPYFLNGTLENAAKNSTATLGKRFPNISFSWLWDKWTQRQYEQYKQDVIALEKQKIDFSILTRNGDSANGFSVSHNEKWLAYALKTGHKNPSIRIMNLVTKEEIILSDILAGSGISWSYNDEWAYFSKSEYTSAYTLYSDLYRFRPEDGREEKLSDGLRAKDPAYCRTQGGDEFLIYTHTFGGFSFLSRYDLRTKRSEKLYSPPIYHHVATPKCSADGKTVFFSEHGTEPLDQIYSLDLTSFVNSDKNDGKTPLSKEASEKSPKLLTGGRQAGFGALFPNPADNGDLYFTLIKDGYYLLALLKSGNKTPDVLAKAPGGFWFPQKIAESVYSSYLSSEGIRLIKINRTNNNQAHKPLDQSTPAINNEFERDKIDALNSISSHSSSYNLLTSLLPRVWFPPVLFLSNYGNRFGLTLLGWDETDQFRYQLAGWYDTLSKAADGMFESNHRILQYRLGLSTGSYVSSVDVSKSPKEYEKVRYAGVRISRLFPAPFASIEPAVVAVWSRTWQSNAQEKNKSHSYEPEQTFGADLVVNNQNQYLYSLAVEESYKFVAKTRGVLANESPAWKSYLSFNQKFSVLPEHSILEFSGLAGFCDNPDIRRPSSVVYVGGTGSESFLNLPLRGYGTGQFKSRKAATGQIQYTFPIKQIFRGFGTFPLFIKNLGAYSFFDAAKFEDLDRQINPLFAGAGGGLIFNNIVFFYAPFKIRLEYAYGFNSNYGGHQMRLDISTVSLSF